MVDDFDYDQQDITYTYFDKIETIIESDIKLALSYGPGQNRKKIESRDASDNLVYRRLYGKQFEQLYVDATELTTNITYLPGGAVYIEKEDGIEEGVGEGLFYLYGDHQGSIIACTDADGNIAGKQSFDAWGRTRNPISWDQTENATPMPEWLIRGYTGHEYYAEYDLINMNGRTYDPRLARMIQVDNFVSDPSSTQSHNRYSYVLNNPLKYTDPSGENPLLLLAFSAISRAGMFAADYASNKIQGVNNAAANAWSNSGRAYNGLNNSASFNFNIGNLDVRIGINPFLVSASISITNITGNSYNTISAGFGYGTWFISGGVGFDNGTVRSGIGYGVGNNHWAIGASFSVGGIGAGYYQTRYGDAVSSISGTSNPQGVGGVNILLGDASIKIENDFLMFSGYDRWRSNGLEISYRDISIGTFLYNNNPDSKEVNVDHLLDDTPSEIWGTNKYDKRAKKYWRSWKNGLTFTSPLYIAYRQGGFTNRAGYSHHSFQDVTQNGAHSSLSIGRQHLYPNYSEFVYGSYFYRGPTNPFSLWGR